VLETFEHGLAPEKVLPADANPPSTIASNSGRDMDSVHGMRHCTAVVMQVLRANIAAPVVAAPLFAALVTPAATSYYLSIKSYS
jgi:hypothetical protein